LDVLIDVAEGLSNCVTSLVSTSCMGNLLGTGTALSVGIEPTSITQNGRTVNVSSGNLLHCFKDQVWIYVGKYSKHCTWSQGEENTRSTYGNLVNCYH
jgi:hypothetical protein